MRIVLDTNVVVSGLLSAVTPPGRVIESVYAGELTVLHDERVLEEYAAVLTRPRFGFTPEDIAWFMAMMDYGESVVAPPLPLTVPDESDLKFIEVAVAGGADAIVTGNLKDFRIAEGRLAIPVVSPRRLVELMRGR
ncbi:MAG: putative toxin-antitoxin system toxin component, PIN family [Gemmatimonadota bacterium]|nr:putative toxin-antitoxin system toxin component, PIN family [Gemmatimonadota bacterium]